MSLAFRLSPMLALLALVVALAPPAVAQTDGRPGTAIAGPAVTYEVLAHFDPARCQTPSSALVRALDGSLYGTMSQGGPYYGGCLYRISPKGKFSVLHDFNPGGPDEGSIPFGGLVLNADGSLTGTTLSGGRYQGGTLFRASTRGDITYLTHFGRDIMGIRGPLGAPTRAADGRLYGTIGGGPNYAGGLYSVDINGGDLLVHHLFGSGRDLRVPATPLLQGSDGALYGSAESGPPGGSGGGVFRWGLDGRYRVLHRMQAIDDGLDPQSGVIQGPDGSLYGTNTSFGGDGNWGDRGTVFRLTPVAGTGRYDYTVIYTGGNANDMPNAPSSLAAGLTLADDGSLWSTSTFGGLFSQGTIFRIASDGRVDILRSFIGNEGSYPHWRLERGDDGWFYGVTQQGGKFGGGVAFRIKLN